MVHRRSGLSKMGNEKREYSISSKWLGLVSALWVQSISGNNYTFANYSVELKAILHINQVQLNGLSTAKDLGKAFGVVAGLLSDIWPPWTILLLGSLEGMLGYGLQWLVISQKIRPLPFWPMCVVMCMGGNSTTWMNTAVLVTCVKNFRRNRGPVSGILKAYVGLSAAIFTDLSVALFKGKASAFVLMLALIPMAVCTVAMFLLKPVEPALVVQTLNDEQEESRCFCFLNALAIVLALYLLAYDLSGVHVDLFSKLIAAGMLLILASPVVLPIYLQFKASRHRGCAEEDVKLGEEEHELEINGGGESSNELAVVEINDAQKDVGGLSTKGDGSDGARAGTAEKDGGGPSTQGDGSNGFTCGAAYCKGGGEGSSGLAAAEKDVEKDVGCPSMNADSARGGTAYCKKKIGEEHTVMEALKTMDFWLLFVCFLAGVGTGMAVINNMGQIGQSKGYSGVGIFVSLISICGFFGRLASGALSESLIRWKGVPRPAVLAASQVLMVVGYVLMALGAPGSLYMGSIVVGVCYGVRFAVSVPVASELFGLKAFGLLYNLLILNLPLGSFMFSSLLAGFLYDREAAKDGGSSSTCLGAHCYRLVFLVMAGFSALGFILDSILTLRTRTLYHQIHLSKLAKE